MSPFMILFIVAFGLAMMAVLLIITLPIIRRAENLDRRKSRRERRQVPQEVSVLARSSRRRIRAATSKLGT